MKCHPHKSYIVCMIMVLMSLLNQVITTRSRMTKAHHSCMSMGIRRGLCFVSIAPTAYFFRTPNSSLQRSKFATMLIHSLNSASYFESVEKKFIGTPFFPIYYNDVYEVNLPPGHRFPMGKYREVRKALQSKIEALSQDERSRVNCGEWPVSWC